VDQYQGMKRKIVVWKIGKSGAFKVKDLYLQLRAD
jgi:hypothetical protein